MNPSLHAPKMATKPDAAVSEPESADRRDSEVKAAHDPPKPTSKAFQRIDRSHADGGQARGGDSRPARSADGGAADKTDSPTATHPVSVTDVPEQHRDRERPSTRAFDPLPESWLRLHATDLIDRLSAWANDLDARESELNARIAKQDARERQFRLLKQVAQTEMDEQQKAIDRLRQQMREQARRLAFHEA